MQTKNINELENEMKTKSLTDTKSNPSKSSMSSFKQKNSKYAPLFDSNSYSSNSSDLSQIDKKNNKLNKEKHLLDQSIDLQNDQSRTEQPKEDIDISSILLEEMISSLQKKLNYFQSKKDMLSSEKKIHDFSQNENIFNNYETTPKFTENKAAKISKKVEKYIDAVTNIDEKIHKCTQSIDSKISFLNQSKTDFLKIQNIIDSVKFKIKKEKKRHELILMKYKNEFKRLARERHEIEKLKFEKSMLKYNKDQAKEKYYDQLYKTKEELISEVKSIGSKKNRSNDRLKRMGSQLKRLIQAESNIKNKLKKIKKRDEKESIISSLLDKLEEKLNEKQVKKEKEFRKDQVETQILLQTFDNLVQTIRREENNEVFEQINLPDFPAKLIQNKNKKEANISKISDEINVVQNDIKLLKKQINKTKKLKDKYQMQICELKKKKDNQMQNNNYVSIYHHENVNIIYQDANNFIPHINNDLSQLKIALEKKKDMVNKRKNAMNSRCENYFLILYEYGKNLQ